MLNAPVKLDEKEAEVAKIDKAALKRVFEKLNFKSLLKRVDKKVTTKAQAEVKEKKKAEEQMNLL
jgi:hypothetical protein